MTPHPAIVAFNALHRRLVRARLLRDGSIGLAAGICVLPLAADTGGAVAVAAVGAAAGLLHGALRAPQALDAARLLDRRLDLDDRLVTCLAVARHDDAVSRLVLDDTVERLQPISHAGVAPMRAAAAVGRVAAAAIVAVLGGAPDTPTAAPGAPVTERPAEAAGGGDESTTEADGAAPGEGAGEASTSPAHPERRGAEGGDATVAGSPDVDIPAPGGPGYLASTPGAGGGAPAGGGEGGQAAAAQAGAAATDASAGGQVRAGGEGLSTAVPGAAAAEAEPFSPRSGTGTPATARVEAALQRANVPPGLRRYVVNYFRAIGR